MHAYSCGEGYGHRITWCQSAYSFQSPTCNGTPIQLGAEGDIVVKRREVILVEDHQLAAVGGGMYAHVLIHFLYLVVLWLGTEVGEHDAIHAEHAVIGPVSVVASVAQISFPIRGIGIDSLVHPVPDGTSAQEVAAFDGIPVVHQVAQRVTHGMSILRDVEGILDACLALDHILHPRHAGVLVGTHIHDVVVALVLHGTALVVSFDGIVCSHKVVARSCLVAQ